MKPIYILIIAAMLTACGSGTEDSKNNNTSNASRNYTPMEDIVEITDLPDYSTLPDTVAGLAGLNRGFLFGTSDNSLNTEGISNPALSYGRRNINEESDGYNDGYVYTNFGSHFVAAILPTTNLGAPLSVGTGQPTEVEWTGTYSVSNLSANAPFTLTINFETGRITGIGNSSPSFRLNGGFDSRGIVTGTFSASARANHASTIAGPITGLIGEQGIIGILHGENSFADRSDSLINSPATVAGGFVADNPNNND